VITHFRAPCALTALLTLLACSSEATPDAPHDDAPSVDTATVTTAAEAIAGFTYATADSTAWRATWRVSGRLVSDPSHTTPVGAIVDGRVVEVRVLPGDRVRAGDVLVMVHTHEMMDARRELAGAVALQRAAVVAAVQAQREQERTERLLELRAASTADVERTRVAAAMARAAREDADAALARAEGLVEHLVGSPEPAGLDPHVALIRSPIDGVVQTRVVQPGEVVLLGAPLVTVARSSGLLLESYVPETGLAALTVGATIRFTVPAYPGERFVATVTRVAPALDAVSRSITLWARVDDPRDRLRAEMVAQGDLESSAGSAALVVPSAAVQAMDGDTVVIVAEPQPEGVRLSAMPVRVGRRTTDAVEILAGLERGVQVVVRGSAIAKAELLKRRGAFADEH
jgi:RND family efflux transporter MFP subunit